MVIPQVVELVCIRKPDWRDKEYLFAECRRRIETAVEAYASRSTRYAAAHERLNIELLRKRSAGIGTEGVPDVASLGFANPVVEHAAAGNTSGMRVHHKPSNLGTPLAQDSAHPDAIHKSWTAAELFTTT